MTFTKKSLNSRQIKRTYTKTKKYVKKKNNWKGILKFIKITFLLFIISSILWTFILYQKYIVDLPSIKELENLEIAESTTIYDREWWELYKIYKEKRTYVPFENINDNMINAIIAWEDKKYWENPWVDLVWITRAVIYRIIWKTDEIWWTSTITQQLIKNTILTSERKIERKIKEIYLSYQLSAWVSKEKIIELYLNKISFWHNAYWIEQAAKTFFWKSSKDVWILESSILASLPKWPTYYSPYNHTDRTLWYLYSYNKENEENISKIITSTDKEKQIDIVDEFINFIESLKTTKLNWTTKWIICWIEPKNFKIDLRIDNDWCSIIEYSKLLNFLNWIKLESGDNYIEYQTWRKDFILWRMLEDWYITFDEYKESIINSIWYKFASVKEEINAPHFVFYVKEYLEKEYWEDIVESWWLKVYTTLDPNMQKKAEEIVEKYSAINKEKFDASNAALISIDNKTWEILSMVWSTDYFDIENKWNVNIITSKLQPWSTFKPFVYSLWMYNEKIWTKTPIYDLETVFPSSYTPANFDWEFMWKLNISTALNNSRNIPAIKMFYMAGWEKQVVNFMEKLWVESLNHKWQYWAPLALWSWEMTPLELASAYSVYANMWEKKEIISILKVVDWKWNIIEEFKQKDGEQVILKEQAYISNSMLSDTSTRPTFWNNYLALSDRKISAKTWTSTKQYIKNGEKDIYPANLWTIWYTPNYTTVVWAWNTNWDKLNYKWNWLEWAWPIMKDYMDYVHKWVPIEDWKEPAWISKINISEISWLLPNPENQSSNYLVESLFINKPTSYDNSFKRIEVDVLCDWKVSDNTPDAAIRNKTLVQLHSLYPSNSKWENPVIEWSQSEKFKEKYWNIPNITTNLNDKICERSWIPSKIIIKSTITENEAFTKWINFIEFAYTSNNPLIKAEILINDEIIDEIDLNNKLKWAYLWTFNIPENYINKKVNLSVRALDSEYYSSENDSHNIIILAKDITAPTIELKNPIDWKIKLYEDTYFNLKASIHDRSNIRTINIRIDWKTVKVWITDRNFSYPINFEKNISVWKHIVQIEVIDKDFNKASKNIELEILGR